MLPVSPVMPDGITLRNAEEMTFALAQKQYRPLPALATTDGTGIVVTRWELTDKEIEEIILTRSIYLTHLTFGYPLQPVIVETKSEFLDSLSIEEPTLGVLQIETAQ